MARAKRKRRNTQNRRSVGPVWRKWIIPAVIALFVIVLVVPTVLTGLNPLGSPAESSSAAPAEDQGQSQQPTALEVGSTAPGFSLEDTEGETISLESLQGKPVVIAFFAPWCPHCQDEAPRLTQIHAEYGDRVHIVSISATPYGKDYGQSRSRITQEPRITIDDLKWFQEEFGVTYPLLFDPEVAVGEVYNIRSFPTTYILDSDHRIVEIFVGGRPVAEFQRVLDGILGNQ
ncbi:MAG: TlpA family protein disulfide reductase [Chloroflexi bacterium]|nr:TlpA family protein disulfide reductase [Chloroflexota bacterium]